MSTTSDRPDFRRTIWNVKRKDLTPKSRAPKPLLTAGILGVTMNNRPFRTIP